MNGGKYMSIFKVYDLQKYYLVENSITMQKEKVDVIKKIDFKIEDNEFVCIMGKSGSGKTTLLKLLGGMDIPSAGTIYYKGRQLYRNSEYQMENYRRTQIGFVFQDYKLLNNMTIRENILLPQILAHKEINEAMKQVQGVTDLLEIGGKLEYYPYELSGGQKQRVAICRAIINNPKVILADEPTGNLDSKSTIEVMRLLIRIKNELKKTIILVTHDPEVAQRSDRTMELQDGQIVY